MRRALALAALGALGGCGDWSGPLQRMEYQDGKYLPYQQNGLFSDGRAMRPLVSGTVPRERLAELKLPHQGLSGDQYLGKVPISLTPELLARGRRWFDITCATCHGLLGDGDSFVARNMALRPPPSLHAYADRPPGFFFEVITNGYGLMARYDDIPVEERWAVVAYVQALQRSQRATIAAAPAEVRRRLEGDTR